MVYSGILSDPSVESSQAGIVARMYGIRSNVLGAMKRFSECKEDASRVTRLRPLWLLGWIRLGGACMALKELQAAVDAFKTAAELWLRSCGGSITDSVGTRSTAKKAEKAARNVGNGTSSETKGNGSVNGDKLEALLGCRDIAERDKEVELVGRMLRTCMSRLSYELKEVDPRERHWVYVLDAMDNKSSTTTTVAAAAAIAKKLSIPSLLHVKMPRNFSWLLPSKLAGVSVPKRREQLVAMDALGIRLLVTCMSEGPLNPVSWRLRLTPYIS
jgi:hypothetical protein